MHRSRANGRPSTSQMPSSPATSTRMSTSQISSDSALTALEPDTPAEDDVQVVTSPKTRLRNPSIMSQEPNSPVVQETLNVRRKAGRPPGSRKKSLAATPIASSSLIVNSKRASSKSKPIYQRAQPEDSCAFCEHETLELPDGNVQSGEEMLSCFNCGSSAHPACLKFEHENTAAGCRTYDWMCQECKRCEVCGKDSVGHPWSVSDLCSCNIVD